MDQPPAGNALLYANRQRFVMLISLNLIGCSTGKSAGAPRGYRTGGECIGATVQTCQSWTWAMSALHRFSDSSRTFPEVRAVPIADICSATNCNVMSRVSKDRLFLWSPGDSFSNSNCVQETKAIKVAVRPWCEETIAASEGRRNGKRLMSARA